jgi:hypothetical protein
MTYANEMELVNAALVESQSRKCREISAVVSLDRVVAVKAISGGFITFAKVTSRPLL